MNEELMLRLLEILNVIVCMSVILIALWSRFGQKKNHVATILLPVILMVLLLLKILGLMPYGELIVLFCLLMVFYHQLQEFNTDIREKSVDHNVPTETIQSIQLRAQEQERSRIYANLHDDVGAQLLQLVYSTKDEESRKIAKGVLSEMRKAVASTQNIQLDIGQLTEDIINESQSRLKTAEILVIIESNIDNKYQKLSLIAPNIICRIIREVVSNVIKHARATQVNLSINSTAVYFDVIVQDNGLGFEESDLNQGKGFKTIKKRAASISAQVQWHSQYSRGCKFHLSYKL